MSYNSSYSNATPGYGQPNPYQSNPYSQEQSNPYAQQQNRYEAENPYNQGGRTQGQAMEMQNYGNNQQGYGNEQQNYGNGVPNGGYGGAQNDPHAILNECREIQRAIDDLEGDLQTLQRAQRGFVSGTGATNREIDAMGADIMGTYRALADRVKRIKSRPEAGNPTNAPQVGNLDRRIKKAINAFQQQESAFRKEVQDQQKRQYLIVNPNATEAELREVSESNGDTQIFQQALLNADRRGQAQTTLRSVQQRHDAIQQIEKTMMELAQLFQDLDAIVVQQDPMIQNVEQQAEDTHQHIVEANVQLQQATVSARAARKKKWICLGIVVAIIIVALIIIFVVLATQGVFKNNSSKSNKRAVDAAVEFVARSDMLPAARRHLLETTFAMRAGQ